MTRAQPWEAISVKVVRDVVLLIGGLALLFNETVLTPEPRPILIAVAVAMLGLPASLIADRTFVRPSSSDPAPQQPTPPPAPTPQDFPPS